MATVDAVGQSYSVRASTPSDLPSILQLVRRSLGDGRIPRDEVFWRWKHEENPFGPSACLVAESAGEIIGLRVFMRWRWQAAGSRIEAVRAVDTATDERFRGRGIFSRLTMALVAQVQAEGVTLVYNTPNEFSRPGYLKMGWTSLGRTSLWVRPSGPLTMLRLAARRDGARETKPAGGAHAVSSVGALLEEDALEPLLAEANAAGGARLNTPLSREFLGWRYARVPGFQYEAWWRLDGDARAAVIYRRRSHRRVDELRIAELLVGANAASRRAARHILQDLARASGCDVVTARARGRDGVRVLAPIGFLSIPALGPVFTVRPLNEAPAGVTPLHRRGWAPSIGDLELF